MFRQIERRRTGRQAEQRVKRNLHGRKCSGRRRRRFRYEPLEERRLLAFAPVAVDDAYLVAQDTTLTVDVAQLPGTPAPEAPVTFSFADFADVSAFTFNGSAAPALDNVDGVPVLRLTESPASYQSGTAFLSSPVPFARDLSFSTRFSYRLSNPAGGSDNDGQGADGMAFVLQDDPRGASAVGGTGPLLGVGGTAAVVPSVAISLNTWRSNRIHVLVDGQTYFYSWNLREQQNDNTFNNGQVQNAWIDYDGTTRTMEVRVAESTIRPASPLVSFEIDLASRFNERDLYVGFSASTGAAMNDHDVRDWQFSTSTEGPELLPAVSLIGDGAEWKYWDQGTDLGTAWREVDFDDSAWPQGPQELGYGDGDEATAISFGPDASAKYPTTYFRRAFTAYDAGKFQDFNVLLKRDDGAAVYVNGVEVARTDNLDANATYGSHTTYGVWDDGNGWIYYAVDPAVLQDGENVVAVEVHQVSDTSSDVSFALTAKGRTLASVGVLGNDTDADGDAITVTLDPGPTSDVQYGTLSLAADGTFTYTPDPGFFGVDAFTYVASDVDGTDTATVTLTVLAPSNKAPIAGDDAYSMLEGMTLVTTAVDGVLANDSDDRDAVPDVVVAVPADPPSNGQLTLNADGSFTYVPNAEFFGTDVFTYRANDGFLDSNAATVTITIAPVSDPPVAVDDQYVMLGDTTLQTVQVTIGPIVADSILDFSGTQGQDGWYYGYYNRSTDPGGIYEADDFTAFDPSFWQGGSWDWPSGNPPWTYLDAVIAVPNGPDSGDVHWTIRRWASDVAGTITVDWSLSKMFTDGNGTTGRILHNGLEVDSATIVADDEIGTNRRVVIEGVEVGDVVDLVVDPVGTDGLPDVNGDVVYSAATIQQGDFQGIPLVVSGDEWRYSDTGTDLGTAWRDPAFDDAGWAGGPSELGYGDADEATVVGFGPNSSNKYPTTYFRHSFDLTPFGWAADVGHLRLLVQRDDGVAVYLNGTEVFRDNLADNAGFSDYTIGGIADDGNAVLWIDVDPSLLVDGENVLAAEVHQSGASSSDLTFDLELFGGIGAAGTLENDYDPDGDWIVARLIDGPDRGTLTFADDGTFAYTPDAGYTGLDTFTYAADEYQFELVGAGSGVRVMIPADGSLGTSWTGGAEPFDDSGAGWIAGTLPVGYSTDLGPGGTDVQAVMEGVNASAWLRVPFALADPAQFDAISLQVAYDDGFVAYINGQEVLARNAPDPVDWNSASDGQVTADAPIMAAVDLGAQPGLFQTGTNVLAVHALNAAADDGDFFLLPELLGVVGTDSATVTIEVTEPAVAMDDVYTVDEDGTLNVGVVDGILSNDQIGVGSSASVVLVSGVGHGVLALAPDGSFLYTPPADFFGADGFTYAIDNGAAFSEPATVTITVVASNDRPVAMPDSYTVRANSTLDAYLPSDPAQTVTAFFTDFESGIPAQFTGGGDLAPAASFEGVGNAGNTFAGSILRNDGGPGAVEVTVLTLTGLPSHTSVDIEFLLAVIDSWDGVSGSGAPDVFGVIVDGNVVLEWGLDNGDPNNVNFAPVAGSLLSYGTDLGFSADGDSAYDMSVEPALRNIPHTGPTLTVQWYAYGYNMSWDGGDDESFGLDNVRVVLYGTGTPRVSGVLMPRGSDWKYLDDGSNQGTLWRDPGYDDSSWAEGPAPLGYGDGDEATVVGYGPNASDKYRTTYFRKDVYIPRLDDIDELFVLLQRDDGGAVYINGIEVGRTPNLSPSADYRTNANYNGLPSIGGYVEDSYVTFQADPSVLVAGMNTLAVEMHQRDGDSSDISFDLELLSAKLPKQHVLANDVDVDGERLRSIQSTEPAYGQVSFNSDGVFRYTPDADYVGPDSFQYQAQAVTELVAPTSAAKLLIPSPANGGDVLGSAWHGGSFDDSAWTDATAGIGFGTKAGSGFLRWDFDDGSLDGWTLLESDVDFGWALSDAYPPPNGRYALSPEPYSQQNQAHDLLRYRSPTFTLADTADLTFALAGGWGSGEIPLGSAPFAPASSGSGFIGVALVDAATGERMLTKRKDTRNTAFQRYGWTQAELAPLAGGQYALELIDNYSGYWGWIAMDSIEIPADTAFDLTPAGTTDVEAEMAGVNPSAFVRVAFEVDPQLSVDQLQLFVAYDDGFTAYIDGVEVASVNAPPSPTYDAAADSGRADGEELVYVPIDLNAYAGLLSPGPHVLAIQAMNVDAFLDPEGSEDFLLQPYLYALENSAPATVSIDVIYVNTPPTAWDDSFDAAEDTLLTADVPGMLGNGVLANDTDGENEPLTAVLVDDAVYGTLALALDGTFTYLPGLDYFGTDYFTYRASDGTDVSNVATVEIVVAPVNDVPVGLPDGYLIDTGVPLSVDAADGVLANDVDVDSVTLSAVLATPPATGTLVLNADGSFTFDPEDSPAGVLTFEYAVTDSVATSAPVLATLLIDTPPVAVDDPDYATLEDVPLLVDATAGVLANDSDAEGDGLAVALRSGTARGTVTLNPDGSFEYTPEENYFGTDSFTYAVTDGDQWSADATVTITLTPVDDPPATVADAYFILQDGLLSVDAAEGVLANDVDPEGAALAAALASDVSTGMLWLQPDGSFLYVPAPGFIGTDTFTYTATDGTNASAPVTVTIVVFDATRQVVINEIMYHPASNNDAQEYIELANFGNGPVSLLNWRFSAGVRFTFPDTILNPGEFLVVAADPTAFANKYPEVANVLGPWEGRLSNRTEQIELVDGLGGRVDRVTYADDGDWGYRTPGPPDQGSTGWIWEAAHDGLGSSLELINPDLSNRYGQNWAASSVAEGTPGTANSVASDDVAPMILDVIHEPAIPRGSEPVTVTTRLADESATGISASLFYRISATSPAAFTELPMFDDGTHGDGEEGDGLFGATIPGLPDGTVVEFYLRATDAGGKSRIWPEPPIIGGSQADPAVGPKLLFQVDDSFDPNAVWTDSSQPTYRIIMSVPEDVEFQNMNDYSSAQMDATFISTDGVETLVRYNTGVRIRGASSRRDDPRGMRVNFRHDDPWLGVTDINLNSQYTWLQLTGSALFQAAGLPSHDATAGHVQMNGVDYTNAGEPQYGSYVQLEVPNTDYAGAHIPADSNGNMYKKRRPDNKWAWRDGDVGDYLNDGWSKMTNSGANDWSDLDTLLYVMNNAAEPTYLEEVSQVADVDQWIRWFATMTLMVDRETNLSNGADDDYLLYSGVLDPRFILLPHDLDTILGQGDTSTNFDDTIWPMIDSGFAWEAMPQLVPFFNNPVIQNKYFAQLKELAETVFAAEQFDPMLDNLLGGFVPQATIDSMKSFAAARMTYVLSQLPATIDVAPTARVTSGPPAITPLDGATLQIGGQDVTYYRYRVNNGPLGPETPVADPIVLAGLADGAYTLDVVGRNASGTWQDVVQDATTVTWTVDSVLSSIRINEILAINTGAFNHEGSFPDVVELYNAGPAAVDLTGMGLSDDPDDPFKFTFGPGTSLGSGQTMVLFANTNDGTSGIHLGFALSGSGEGVYLFADALSGGAMIDGVAFGVQLDGLSIGRDAEYRWNLNLPTIGGANIVQPMGDPAGLLINEWLAESDRLYRDDRIELYNPGPVPVALGGLYLTDDLAAYPARHPIAPLSFIAADGYAVFVADENTGAGADHVGFRLSPSGEMIALVDPVQGPIDTVLFGPQAPDVSQGRNPNGLEPFSLFDPPNLGAANPSVVISAVELVAMDANWRYEQMGSDLGTAWRDPDYDDSTWPEGQAYLAYESGELPFDEQYRNTELLLDADGDGNQTMTFYFRSEFKLNADPADVALQITHVVDDGMIVYLNGYEVYRYNMDVDPYDYLTPATGWGWDAQWLGPFDVPTSVDGQYVLIDDRNDPDAMNVIAVEVHQVNEDSSDVVFGLRLDSVVTTVVGEVVEVTDMLDQLAITEIMYNPPGGSSFEFVELQNRGPEPLNIEGIRFIDGIDFTFPDVDVAPGDYVLAVSDSAAFESRYGAGLNVVGQYDGKLNNGGETLVLALPEPYNGRIADFTYDDGGAWPGRADGTGSSLELIAPAAMPKLEPDRGDYLDDGDNWRASSEYLGTPGLTGTGPIVTVVVNEVLSHSEDPDVDYIELYNSTAAPIDVSHWWLSDSAANLTKFRIPAGTTLDPDGYAVFYETDFNPTPETPAPNHFALDGSHGDDVWLLEGVENGPVPVRFVDRVEFGPARSGESFGRWPDETFALYPALLNTPDDVNSEPRIGPLVISEVMYNPPDPGIAGIVGADLEFVEIFNPTPYAVDLAGWTVADGIDFTFPDGLMLDRGTVVVAVPFDPATDAGKLAAFDSVYQPPAGILLAGPYSGKLDNGGDAVRLLRADAPPEDEPGYHPLVIEDEVRYDDQPAWPAGADGGGNALARAARDLWGNAPGSWLATAPDPGRTALTVDPAVLGRFVFYNNSVFDGNDGAINTADYAAIAADKLALMPGQTPTFANYTSFSGGINGLIIDLSDADPANLDLAGFEFQLGNAPDVQTWLPAVDPNAMAVRDGEGVDGSTRVMFTWNDGSIVGQWLRVTVKSDLGALGDLGTGLWADDVFYFGNAAGESGNSPADALVNAADIVGVRDNPRGPASPAGSTGRFDFNRDGRVDAIDLVIARDNSRSPLSALRLSAAPPRAFAPPPPPPLPPAASGQPTTQSGATQFDAVQFDAVRLPTRDWGRAVDSLLGKKWFFRF